MAVAAKWIIGAVIVIVALATVWYLVQKPQPAENSLSSRVGSSADPLGSSFEVSDEVASTVDPNAFANVRTNPFENGTGG